MLSVIEARRALWESIGAWEDLVALCKQSAFEHAEAIRAIEHAASEAPALETPLEVPAALRRTRALPSSHAPCTP